VLLASDLCRAKRVRASTYCALNPLRMNTCETVSKQASERHYLPYIEELKDAHVATNKRILEAAGAD
jgi:hypothetical protein